MTQQADKTFDIVIAGGGMIGSSLALALAPLGLSVAVVEAVPRQADDQPSFDDRSTGLARSTRRMFEAMGLWERIEAASTPIGSVHVSDQGRFGFSHIDAAQQGVDALGHVVINRVLGDVLQQRLETEGCAELICPARITAVDLLPEAAIVTVTPADGSAPQRIHCRLVVAADGANSSVREMLGIGVTRTPYGQRAVIGNVLPDRPHGNRAFERFTEHGPLALLPVADNRVAFVWTVDEADADGVMSLDDAAFLAALQAEFGYRLGSFAKVGRRACYPLALSRAMRLTATRSVLVGNAAHGLHPVSAQGFNLGMRDVAALVDCIADARDGDGAIDPGRQDLLARYAQWRRADQRKLVHFTDSLVRLFGSDRAPLRALRNIGMLGFDLLPGVRSVFAKHTMGLAGRLPRLSRGMPVK